jgi:hypothetical protein
MAEETMTKRNGITTHQMDIASQALGSTLEPVGPATGLLGIAAEELGPTTQVKGVMPDILGSASSATGAPAERQATTPRRQAVTWSAHASIPRRLLAAHLAIEGALAEPALVERLATYGYDRVRLLEGRALLDRALNLAQQQQARRGDQLAATDARRLAQSQAHVIYMRHVAVARVAFRDNRGTADKLGVAGVRKTTQAGWLMQARQFYTNALDDAAVANQLAAYGVTHAQLAAARQQVAAVAEGAVAQGYRMGVAQESTRARDEALAALDRWMRDFLAIARVARA